MQRNSIAFMAAILTAVVIFNIYISSGARIEAFECWCRGDDATGGAGTKTSIQFGAAGVTTASIASGASMATGAVSTIDTASGYSAVTGKYTAPVAGNYFFYLTLRSPDGNNAPIGGSWAVNGQNDPLQVFEYADPNGRRMLSTHTIKTLKKGDIVHFSNIVAYNLANQVDWGGYLVAS